MNTDSARHKLRFVPALPRVTSGERTFPLRKPGSGGCLFVFICVHLWLF
jgi:hypothetical protein